MGVLKLWKVLQPSSRKESFHELSLTKGYMENPSGERGFRVAFDASAVTYKQSYHHGHRQTKNSELASIFAFVTRIATLPILPIFVFDGPGRPNQKRGKTVRGTPHHLAQDFMDILDGMGIAHVTAPGEAEAEMAHLNQVGEVDAVWTHDSDIFVFGALCVLRPINPQDLTVDVFTAYNIANHDDVKLAEDDLIFVALLAGGDYSSGLPKCGTESAVSIARSHLGRPLIQAAKTLIPSALRSFIKTWKISFLNELRLNESGTLPRRYPAVASACPNDWPRLREIQFYVQPLTSSTSTNPPPSLRWKQPNLPQLARICAVNFTWGHTAVKMLDKFDSAGVFTALTMRNLIVETIAQDTHTTTPSLIDIVPTSIRSERRKAYTGFMAEVRVDIAVGATVFSDILDAVSTVLGSPYKVNSFRDGAFDWVQTKGAKLRAWVPLTLVEDAASGLAAAYHAKKSASRTRKRATKRKDVIDLTGDDDDEVLFTRVAPKRRKIREEVRRVFEHPDGVLEFF